VTAGEPARSEGEADRRVRPFRAGDDETVVALWNATLGRDPLSAALFRRQTLLDPGFDPAGCVLAERGGQAVGFALARTPAGGGRFAAPAGGGYLVGLGVLPAARGQGVGTGLLGAALAFLRARACATVSAAAHEYYAAGIDREAYAPGIAFLQRRGFREVGEAVAMGRRLYDLAWPDAVRAAAARLEGEGVRVRAVRPEDAYPLAVYFREEFPAWAEFFTRKLDGGHPAEEIVVATHAGRVVGYCQHLDSDHVGPFGVARDHRGRGIGSVMLYRLLEGMRARGYRFAWFGETGRARPYYERAGFEVTRRYALLQRDLRAGD
jgi:ribosomal protein S18 acetylase RimI-like enzyme